MHDLMNYLQEDRNNIIERPSFQYLINFVLHLNKTCTCTLQVKVGKWRRERIRRSVSQRAREAVNTITIKLKSHWFLFKSQMIRMNILQETKSNVNKDNYKSIISNHLISTTHFFEVN